MNKKKVLLSCIILLFCSASSFAATKTWNPTDPYASKTWSLDENWSPYGCPVAGDDISFDASNNSSSIIDAAFNVSVRSITINPGYLGVITQNNDLTVTSTFEQSGGVFVSDHTRQFNIGGSFLVTGEAIFSRYTGLGTAGSPYIIYDIYGLQAINCSLEASYKLNNHIDASVTANWNYKTLPPPDLRATFEGFIPLGWNGSKTFNGTFDGNFKEVKDIKIDRYNEQKLGFFADIGPAGLVKNLGLTNCKIAGTSIYYVGGLVGSNEGGMIKNCSVTGEVASYAGYAQCDSKIFGGLAGGNLGSIYFSYCQANLIRKNDGGFTEYGGSYGGLVGQSVNGYLYNCYSKPSFYFSNMHWQSTIGGLVGSAYSTNVANCYVAGSIPVPIRTWVMGGLVGDMSAGVILRSYFSDSYLNNGLGTLASIPQMSKEATFTGWDFSTIWSIDENKSTPYFLWQMYGWADDAVSSNWEDPLNWNKEFGYPRTPSDKVYFGFPNNTVLAPSNESLSIGGIKVGPDFLRTIRLQNNMTLTTSSNRSGTFVMYKGTFEVNGNTLKVGGSFDISTEARFYSTRVSSANNSGTVEFIDADTYSLVKGRTRFYNLACYTPYKRITFESGSMTTVEGSLVLSGESGKEILIKATYPGSRWFLKPNDSSVTVKNVIVSDSHNLGATISAQDCYDGGNNIGWDFSGGGASVSVLTNEGGSISPSGTLGQVIIGTTESKTFTIEAASGSYIGFVRKDGIYQTGVSLDKYEITISGNSGHHSIEAYFVINGKKVWDGGAEDNNWTSDRNWTGDSVPVNTGTVEVFFNAVSVKNTSINTAITIKDITIESSYNGKITQSGNITLIGTYEQYGGTFECTNPDTFSFSTGGGFKIPDAPGSFLRFSGGPGTSVSDPYLVHDVYGLQGARCGLDKYYKLHDDIDASVTAGWNWDSYNGTCEGFRSIGYDTSHYPDISDTASNPFTGNFNGNNHKISNLCIRAFREQLVGVFGAISTGCKIYNLSVENLILRHNYLSGYNSYSGGIGFIGFIFGGTGSPSPEVYDCSVSGSIVGTGTGYGGGLIGGTSYSKMLIKRCYVDFYVIGTVYQRGTFIGNGSPYYSSDPVFVDCYSTGVAGGTSSVGGFAGSINLVRNCYTTASLEAGGQYSGGFAYSASNLTGCYYTHYDPAFNSIGTRLTTRESKTKAAFAGYDFDNVWSIDEHLTTPYLLWKVYNWSGETSASWDNANNWMKNLARTANYPQLVTDKVFINNSSPVSTPVSGVTLNIGELRLGSSFSSILTLESNMLLSNEVNYSGNLVINGGKLNASNKTISIEGNFEKAKNGVFLYGTSTIEFVGNDTVSLLRGSAEVYNLICRTPGKVLSFESGTIHTIEGAMVFSGEAVPGRYLTLGGSGTSAEVWYINPKASKIARNLIVSSSWNINSNPITAENSFDGGNNRGWSLFSGAVIRAIAGTGGTISPAGDILVATAESVKITVTPTAGYYIRDVRINGRSTTESLNSPSKDFYFSGGISAQSIEAIFITDDTRVWTGLGTTPVWSNGNNWTGNFPPSSSQIVLFPSGISSISSTVDAGFNASNTVKGVTIESGSTIVITQESSLNVAGDFRQYGGKFRCYDPGTCALTVEGTFTIPTLDAIGGDPSFLRLSGSGTSVSDPYLIYDVYGLQGLSGFVSVFKFFKLANDIDAYSTVNWNWNPTTSTTEGFSPFGLDYYKYFSGNISGDAHSINGLYMNKPVYNSSFNYVGLIKYGSGCVINGIRLNDYYISGREYVGSLAGVMNNSFVLSSSFNGVVTGKGYIGGAVGDINSSMVRNCTAEGRILPQTPIDFWASDSGGLIGSAYYTTVEGCSSFVSLEGGSNYRLGGLIGNAYGSNIISSNSNRYISGGSMIGGLIAWLDNSNMYGCWSSSRVEALSNSVGGLIGQIQNTGNIYCSYFIGTVKSSSYSGGLVGQTNQYMNMRDCYARATFEGNNSGGLVGFMSSDSNNIYNSYAVSDFKGINNGGIVGNATYGYVYNSFFTAQSANNGKGILTSEANMKKKSNFEAVGWDFGNIWGIDEYRSYPYFQSEKYLWVGTSGGGDGTTWGDAGNWNQKAVPAASSCKVYINTAEADITTSGQMTLGGLQLGTQFNKKLTLGGGLIFSSEAGLDASLVMRSGTFDVSSNNYGVTVEGLFDKGPSSDFIKRAGIVHISAGPYPSRIKGSTSFYGLYCSSPNAVISFDAGSLQTIEGKFRMIAPNYQSRIALRSSVDGAQWSVSCEGIKEIRYITGKDSRNISVNAITAESSINYGNNINWDFSNHAVLVTVRDHGYVNSMSGTFYVDTEEGDSLTLIVTPESGSYYISEVKIDGVPATAELVPAPKLFTLEAIDRFHTFEAIFNSVGEKIWTGKGATCNWSDRLNWSGNSTPSAHEIARFNSTSTKASTIDAAFSGVVAGVSIESGYTGTIEQKSSLTVNGSFEQSSGGYFVCSNPTTCAFNVSGQFSIPVKDASFVRYTGTGTDSANVYVIYDIYGLQAVKCNLAKYFKLYFDITADATSNWNWNAFFGTHEGFSPIGDFEHPFTGNFNGNSFYIKNLFIDRINEGFIGLFGATGQGAYIYDLGVINSSVRGSSYVGVLAGSNNGYIYRCKTSDGYVYGQDYKGGFVAYNASTIESSYSTITVDNGWYSYSGGFVGNNDGNITKCYTSAYTNGAFPFTEGPVNVTDSYYDNSKSGSSGTNYGAVERSPAELKRQGNFNGWNFDTVWTIDEEKGYPSLLWESYVWTGLGGTIHWTNPLNWNRKSGYPSINDKAFINSGLGVVTPAQDLYLGALILGPNLTPGQGVSLLGNLYLGTNSTREGSLLILGGGFATGVNTKVIVEGRFKNASSPGSVQFENNSTIMFAGSGVSTIEGSTTFYNFYCTKEGKSLVFAKDSVQTFEGVFRVSGEAANKITLRCTLEGGNWYVNPKGTREAMYFIDVKDSTNLSSEVINPFYSVNSGNTYNWFDTYYITAETTNFGTPDAETYWGTIEPKGNVPVYHGYSRVFYITPYLGYKIGDVRVDGVSQGAVSSWEFSPVTEGHTIEAIFEVRPFVVTTEATGNGQGTITPTFEMSRNQYKEITIEAQAGSYIAYVKVDGVVTAEGLSNPNIYPSPYRITFEGTTADHTVEAHFLLSNYWIWTGRGSSEYWSEAANWTMNTTPDGTANVIFNEIGRKDSIVDADFNGTMETLYIAPSYGGNFTVSRVVTIESDVSIESGSIGLWEDVYFLGDLLISGEASVDSTSTNYFAKGSGTQRVYNFSTSYSITLNNMVHSGAGQVTLSGEVLNVNDFLNASGAGTFELYKTGLYISGSFTNESYFRHVHDWSAPIDYESFLSVKNSIIFQGGGNSSLNPGGTGEGKALPIIVDHFNNVTLDSPVKAIGLYGLHGDFNANGNDLFLSSFIYMSKYLPTYSYYEANGNTVHIISAESEVSSDLYPRFVMSGEVPFHGLKCEVPSKDILVGPGSLITIEGTGFIHLEGGITTPEYISFAGSGEPPSQWRFDPRCPAQNRILRYLYVKDSRNINAETITIEASKSIDGGNNTGWRFIYIFMSTSEGYGTAEPSGTIFVDVGGSVTYEAFADYGYRIDRIIQDGAIVASDGYSYLHTFEAIDRDHSMEAYFVVRPFVVTAEVTGNGSGTINPSGNVEIGHYQNKTFTIEAEIPNSYVAYVRVDGGVTREGLSDPNIYPSPYQVTFESVFADHTVEAHILPVTYRIWSGLGLTNKWSEPANWTGAVTPDATSYVVFNSLSTKNSSIDADFTGSIRGISINRGYTGAIDISRTFTVESYVSIESGSLKQMNNDLYVGGDWRVLSDGSGSFISEGGAVIFNKPLGVQTIQTSGEYSIFYDLEHSGDATLLVSNDAVLLLNDFYNLNGTFKLYHSDMAVYGNFLNSGVFSQEIMFRDDIPNYVVFVRDEGVQTLNMGGTGEGHVIPLLLHEGAGQIKLLGDLEVNLLINSDDGGFDANNNDVYVSTYLIGENFFQNSGNVRLTSTPLYLRPILSELFGFDEGDVALISGAVNVLGFSCSLPSKKILFINPIIITVEAGGYLTFEGGLNSTYEAIYLGKLFSSDQWLIDAKAPSRVVSGVYVENSRNIDPTEIVADNSYDGGNNTGWIFSNLRIVETHNSGGTVEPIGTIYPARNSAVTYEVRANSGHYIGYILKDGVPVISEGSYTSPYKVTFEAITRNHTMEVFFDTTGGRTWTGGGTTENWSEPGNWSGNQVPSATEEALFNGMSVKDSTIDIMFGNAVGGISIESGYTGTITQARDVLITNRFEQAGGSFVSPVQYGFTVEGSFSIPDTAGAFSRFTQLSPTERIIYDVYGLQAVKCFGDVFSLNNDISAEVTARWNPTTEGFLGFDPIGNAETNYDFDGNGFVISGLTIRRPQDNVGLFGVIGSGGVYNLGIINASVEGVGNVGIVAGSNIAGAVYRSFARGFVSGTGSDIGGLVGENANFAAVSDCYSSAEVYGSSNVGGLAGNNSGNISNSYSTGFVNGAAAGGFAGVNTGTVNRCHFTDSSHDNGIGSLETVSQIKQKTRFSGWDFDTYWTIDESKSSPQLMWEIYAWTGSADGTTWTNPNNWNKKKGYPSSKEDKAFINTGSATISIDPTILGGLQLGPSFGGIVKASPALSFDNSGTREGSLTILGGKFSVDDRNISIAGNFKKSSSATFEGSSSRSVTFTTASPSLIEGSTVFKDVICNVPGKRLTFEAGSIQTIEGVLTISGEAGNFITLESSIPGSQFKISSEVRSIYFVSVKDSTNESSTVLDPGGSNLNLGNTSRWFTYYIYATTEPHGIITPEGTRAVTITTTEPTTYTITTEAGYYVSDVKVDNISQGVLTSYSFSDIRASHTIEVLVTTEARITEEPRGLRVNVSGSDVVLSWNVVGMATQYRIYRSASKTAPIMSGWTLVGSVDSPSLTWSDAGITGTTTEAYYIVRAFNSGGESGNSSMGVYRKLSFVKNTDNTNYIWVSIPYNTPYNRASDIVTSIEGGTGAGTNTKIDQIGLWVPGTQTAQLYSYNSGQNRWPPLSDFAIPAGRGVYLYVTASFTWEMAGVDSVATITLEATDTDSLYYNFISLPYTSSYEAASDIVTEIEGGTGAGTNTKIDQIGLWVPGTQAAQLYSYNSGQNRWPPLSNFTIPVGGGIYIHMSGGVSSYNWIPGLKIPPRE